MKAGSQIWKEPSFVSVPFWTWPSGHHLFAGPFFTTMACKTAVLAAAKVHKKVPYLSIFALLLSESKSNALTNECNTHFCRKSTE